MFYLLYLALVADLVPLLYTHCTGCNILIKSAHPLFPSFMCRTTCAVLYDYPWQIQPFSAFAR
jgi:hypothetical protein